MKDIELELKDLLRKKHKAEDDVAYFSTLLQEVRDKLKASRARVKEIDVKISTALQKYIMIRARYSVGQPELEKPSFIGTSTLQKKQPVAIGTSALGSDPFTEETGNVVRPRPLITYYY